jgi:integrase
MGKHGRPIHPSTIKSDLRVLSIVWTYAQDEDIVDSPFPGRRLRIPKPGAKPPFQTKEQIERILDTRSHTAQERKEIWQRVFLTVGEIDKFLDHVEENADYPFIYPMFVMAAHTGARRSELIRSQRDDVFFAEQVMSIREKKRVRHRQSIRTVPISTRLQEALSEWFDCHPGGSFTFQAEEHLRNSNKVREIGQGITRDEAHNYFKRTLADSEWSELPGWHCLRHSFVSNCASKGIDARTIMSWVGHMTPEIQERYRHLIPMQMRAELNQVFG